MLKNIFIIFYKHARVYTITEQDYRAYKLVIEGIIHVYEIMQ